MVSTKQKSRKMKMGMRAKKSNRSRKQHGGQTSTMSESTSSMPELSSSTSSMPELSSSTMPTSTMPTSTLPTTTSRVSKLPMSSSTSTKPPTSTLKTPLKKVDIYFKLEGGVPKFVSSSDPGITVDTTPIIAQTTMNINPSLGKLHDYSGSGWSQANRWVSVPPSRMNQSRNALRLSVGDNLIRKIGARSILPKQIQLPSLLSTVVAKGLDKAIFGIGTKPGDPKNGNAVMLITLMFA